MQIYSLAKAFLGDVIKSLRALNTERRRIRGWRGTERRRNRPARPDCVAVLGIMKNERHSIDEWVEHYLALGVGKVFLIDNGSTDDTVAKAQRWVDAGKVELVQYPKQHQQVAHYWAAFQEFRIAERFDWIAIADLDEFWFPKSGGSLPDLLARFPDADVLTTNWSQFGSSGHISQPASLRQNLTKRLPDLHTCQKCIVRTHVPVRDKMLLVHHVRGVKTSRTFVENDSLQLNHYALQSREFWVNTKLKRGDAYYPTMDVDFMERRFSETDLAATFDDVRLRDLVQSGQLGKVKKG